jgi:hypothetical protein
MPTNAAIQIGPKKPEKRQGQEIISQSRRFKSVIQKHPRQANLGTIHRTKIKTLFSIEKNPEQVQQEAQNTLNPQNQKTKKQGQCSQKAR